MKHICMGLLAHVDAGKTTLSEALLYLCGSIRRLGRVDKKDTFLDWDSQERSRGITIFSKQARLFVEDAEITLLDTPGHVDFSAEMERTLQVLDVAVLVIGGKDGVQGHTHTLWRLLARYHIPVFIFVNKMDQPDTGRDRLLSQLRERLDEGCADFSGDWGEVLEQAALCDEGLMERYLETGELDDGDLSALIVGRKLFPCWFGSALNLDGVDGLLDGLARFALEPDWPEAFAARVFKISRDSRGERLTWLKVTGGTLRVRDTVKGPDWEEKAAQLRLYSGAKFAPAEEAPAGTVCAVTGLTRTRAGQGLGAEEDWAGPELEPVLAYQILPPAGGDAHTLLAQLRILEEEDPQLQVEWNEGLGEIRVHLMGEVQLEVLSRLMERRFGGSVAFGPGRIVYLETIAAPAEGVGHFEPLRHYAEVHLLLEPLERGAGLELDTACDQNVLDGHWQRLILTHLMEKEHKGVLTGAPVTDLRITLLTGRAHLKHTEGGDFRQATYRAVRQGLMQAKSVLLEPYYAFRLELPQDLVGRAMADVEKMNGSFEPPEGDGVWCVLTGTAPVSGMRNYQQEVRAYTKGRGRLFCTLSGYAPCHNQEEILAKSTYDPELDPENPPDSVFCYHGAGTIIPWYDVPGHMHLEPMLADKSKEPSGQNVLVPREPKGPPIGTEEEEKELEAIFTRTFGVPKRRDPKENARREVFNEKPRASTPGVKFREKLPEYLLVDGYNVIFAWEELSELAKTNIDGARGKLMDILCNYQGFRQCSLILVFDAYRVEGHREEVLPYHNIHVVYTREAETADQYIERTAHEIGRKYQVTVATSDKLEQIIIRGQGCVMMSARELREEIQRISQEIRTQYTDRFPGSKNYLFDSLPDELAEQMRQIRLGQKSMEEE